jgi:hypothetical protein
VAAEAVFNTHTTSTDPPASVGHEVLVLATLFVAAVFMTALRVYGLKQSLGRRTGRPLRRWLSSLLTTVSS